MASRKLSSMTDEEVLQEQLKWCKEYLRLCTISEDELKQSPEEYRRYLKIERYTKVLEEETSRRKMRQPN